MDTASRIGLRFGKDGDNKWRCGKMIRKRVKKGCERVIRRFVSRSSPRVTELLTGSTASLCHAANPLHACGTQSARSNCR
jgi:hypothetical protein